MQSRYHFVICVEHYVDGFHAEDVCYSLLNLQKVVTWFDMQKDCLIFSLEADVCCHSNNGNFFMWTNDKSDICVFPISFHNYFKITTEGCEQQRRRFTYFFYHFVVS